MLLPKGSEFPQQLRVDVFRLQKFKHPLTSFVVKTHKQLAKQLGKHQRRLLLRLVDLEAALRDQSCLDSFMSGYRVAHGIHQELLADQPPYNFEDEDERLACERLREG